MYWVVLNRVCMYTDWVLDSQHHTTCVGPPYPICTPYKYINPRPQFRPCSGAHIVFYCQRYVMALQQWHNCCNNTHKLTT